MARRFCVVVFLTSCLSACLAGGVVAPDDAAPPGGEPTSQEPTVVAYTQERDTVRMQPFKVLLNKTAAVVGTSPDDPMFDGLRARRLELGDHDFANGIRPDTRWSASHMTMWVEAMRPVCNSPAFRARYPQFPDSLSAFVPSAYGRPAEDSDVEALNTALADAQLDDAGRYRAACLALLSSTEFVVR